MTYKARIKAERESDNVVSYSDMWPCELYVPPPPNVGGNIPDFIPKESKTSIQDKGWWGLYDWLGLSKHNNH